MLLTEDLLWGNWSDKSPSNSGFSMPPCAAPASAAFTPQVFSVPLPHLGTRGMLRPAPCRSSQPGGGGGRRVVICRGSGLNGEPCAAPASQSPGPSVAPRCTCVLSAIVTSRRGQSHLVGMEFMAFLWMTSEATQAPWAHSQQWNGGSVTAAAARVHMGWGGDGGGGEP